MEFLQPGWVKKIHSEDVGWALVFEEFAESFKLKFRCPKPPTRARQSMLFRALQVMPHFSLHFLQLIAESVRKSGSGPNWKCVFIAVF